MILDAVDNIDRYADRNPGFGLVHAFLCQNNIQNLALGTYEIDGERVFASIEKCSGKGRQHARLEAHRKYIDIQLCVTGSDEIGIKPLESCRSVTAEYDDARDIEFYSDTADTWVRIDRQTCAILFPEDVHAPLAGNGEIIKLVFKIAVM
jgi:biofilm protein TabA